MTGAPGDRTAMRGEDTEPGVPPVVRDGPATTPPRRIALCITDLDAGGAEQCLAHVALGLDRSAWQPHVFCLSRRGILAERLENGGVPCTCLGWRGSRDAWRILDLARRLHAFRPELLQTFLFHANVAGRIAGRLARVPVIVSGIRVAEREKSWHVRLERMTRFLATHHVCVSEAVARFSRQYARLAPATVSVIPNGVDLAKFQSARPLAPHELNAPPETLWMLCVGRLHPQKGQRLLLEAVAPLLESHPRWRLMLVGEGPMRQSLEEHIERLRCRDQVRLLGWRVDVPRLMKTATLLVLPSLWEGLPNVVLEAMAAGLPVVASDVEGVREVLETGVTGLIVEPGSAVALRAALAGLLGDPQRLSELHRNAQSAAINVLTTSVMVQRYEALYRELLQSACC